MPLVALLPFAVLGGETPFATVAEEADWACCCRGTLRGEEAATSTGGDPGVSGITLLFPVFLTIGVEGGETIASSLFFAVFRFVEDGLAIVLHAWNASDCENRSQQSSGVERVNGIKERRKWEGN
jgi:hypothetical protein